MYVTAQGRYEGSMTNFHGIIVDLDDCDCPECFHLDPWDEHRRYQLVVQPDARTSTVRLDHVQSSSLVSAARR